MSQSILTRVIGYLGLGLLFQAEPALASGLVINPVLISLTAKLPTAVVQMRNDTLSVTRYQVTALAWSESPSGEMNLGPTADVVFFPSLLALKPGEQRSLRVGTLAAAAGSEKSYRLFVEQLPDALGSGHDLQFRTRIGIPIFVEPREGVARLRIASLRGTRRAVVASLENAGSMHTRTQRVSLRALDGMGAPLAERHWDGWYVLAGGSRTYELALSQDCARIRAVSVEVLRVAEPPLRQRLDTPAGVCVP